MKTFTDKNGKAWSIVIHVDAIKRVRDVLGINLWKIVEGNELLEQLADPVTLVDVLFVLCQEQAEAQSITDVQFGRSLDGDVLEAAANGLLEALIAFFPQARRDVLSKVLAKGRAVESLALQRANQAIDGVDPEAILAELMKSSLPEKQRSDSPGSSPASSA